MNGSIRRRGGNSWELTIEVDRGADGRRRRKFVNVKGKKADAERKLRELLGAMDKGIPISTEKITLAEWLDKWMSEYVCLHRPRTQERYQGIVERHIVPRIGHLLLRKVSPSHIKALESELTAQGMAAAGVELVHTVISGALKYALSLEVIWRNPAQGVTPPKRPNTERGTSEMPEVRRILKRGLDEGHPLHPAIHLIAYTGIRRGEALGLMWSDVDEDAGAITFNRSVVRIRGQGIVIQPTKTDRSRRKLDVDTDTIAVLRAHRARQNEHRLQLRGAYEDQGLVFPHALGGPLNPMALTRAFKSLARKEGVPHTKLHSLRHFHASALFEQGESPMLVSRRLGHASIKTTIDIYGHLFEGAQRRAAEKFAKGMRDAG